MSSPGRFPAKPVAEHPYLRVTVDVVEHHDQSTLRRKVYLQLMLHQCSFSVKKIRAGAATMQDLGERSGCRRHAGVQLTVLLTVACSTCLLRKHRAPDSYVCFLPQCITAFRTLLWQVSAQGPVSPASVHSTIIRLVSLLR